MYKRQVFVVLSVTGFGTRDAHRKQLRITIPENLNYMAVFDDIFDKYLSENVLRKVKTTNMGTMFELTYECRMKDESEQKQFIDELRVRNGNLNITMAVSYTHLDVYKRQVAALPYDVYDSKEARAEVEREPLSFLKIDKMCIRDRPWSFYWSCITRGCCWRTYCFS